MAQEQQPYRPGKVRRADVEALAATLFVRRCAATTGRTPEALAREALEAARAFYRVCDEPPTTAG